MHQTEKTPGADKAREGQVDVQLGGEHPEFIVTGRRTQAVCMRCRLLGWILARRDQGFSVFGRSGESYGRVNTETAAVAALLAKAGLAV